MRELGIADCPECIRLEALRCECIKKYVSLFEARQQLQGDMSLATPALDQAIPLAESKLNEAWLCLTEHRRSHATVTSAVAD